MTEKLYNFGPDGSTVYIYLGPVSLVLTVADARKLVQAYANIEEALKGHQHWRAGHFLGEYHVTAGAGCLDNTPISLFAYTFSRQEEGYRIHAGPACFVVPWETMQTTMEQLRDELLVVPGVPAEEPVLDGWSAYLAGRPTTFAEWCDDYLRKGVDRPALGKGSALAVSELIQLADAFDARMEYLCQPNRADRWFEPSHINA